MNIIEFREFLSTFNINSSLEDDSFYGVILDKIDFMEIRIKPNKVNIQLFQDDETTKTYLNLSYKDAAKKIISITDKYD